jgi:hypothetical protein
MRCRNVQVGRSYWQCPAGESVKRDRRSLRQLLLSREGAESYSKWKGWGPLVVVLMLDNADQIAYAELYAIALCAAYGDKRLNPDGTGADGGITGKKGRWCTCYT